MSGQSRFEAIIRRFVARQHGVVARWQLLAVGVPEHVIDHRVNRGRLEVVHRGVYVVGHLSRHGRWMAAILAAGEGAVLSHSSAAALWAIGDEGDTIHVTAGKSRESRDGYRVHHSSVAKKERTWRDGIPVTTVARTIEDLARSGVDPEAVYREAHIKRLITPQMLSGSRVKAIRAMLDDEITKSQLEAGFRRFLKRHRLPLPDDSNVVMPWGEADCVWTERRLAIELDSFGVHSTRSAFERDRARDRKAALLGWRVLRVTARQMRDPLAVELRGLLA